MDQFMIRQHQFYELLDEPHPGFASRALRDRLPTASSCRLLGAARRLQYRGATVAIDPKRPLSQDQAIPSI